MDTSPNLKLPYLMAAQAQKHVTYNEAMRALDALVQLTVVDRTHAAPPASPSNGDRYIVAQPATAAWAGHDGHVAVYQDGAWAFYVPTQGWLAWIAAEATILAYDGAHWSPAITVPSLDNIARLGINATADASNRLAVAAATSLFNHDGAGHRLKINKAAAAQTASLLWQDNFSGRAEVGLTGDDDFHFKVSPDGATWKDAIVINRSSGAVSLPFTTLGSGSSSNLAAPVVITPAAGVQSFVSKFDPTPMAASAALLAAVVGVYTDANSNAAIPLTDSFGAARNSPNIVWSQGWNFDSNGARLDATRPAFGFALEYNYFLATSAGMKRGVEGHWKLQPPGTPERRPITFWAPWDGGAGSTISINMDQIVFGKFDFTSKLQMDWTGATGLIDFMGPTQLQFRNNNSVVHRQMNAAGTDFKALPYIDGYDRCVLNTTPLVIGGASPDAQQNAVFSIFGSTMADTKFIANWSFPNVVTGTVRAHYIGGQATTELNREIWNYGTGNAVDRLKTSGGDAFDQFWLNSVGVWSAGAKSDNTYRIARSTALGTNDVLVADANAIALKQPIKLPSYTVAGLPSAATVGAGAIAFVTNASGGPTLACSDGAVWKVAAALGATVS